MRRKNKVPVSRADDKTGCVGTKKRREVTLAAFLLRPNIFLKAKPFVMPEEDVIERAREDAREGKSPSTQAGEFVREEMEHIREEEHGARSPEQAIAIGLSKA